MIPGYSLLLNDSFGLYIHFHFIITLLQRSAVNVEWKSSHQKTACRIGYKGKVGWMYVHIVGPGLQ